MIGFYDYTVILTYASVVSATVGIFVALTGAQHPYIATFCLMFCGLCDAFDGRVARKKKDRTKDMCVFGVQIDSLSDMIAFGVLPVCIGYSMRETIFAAQHGIVWQAVIAVVISCAYVLCALIRLAYFNVTEEQRQQTQAGERKHYTGLPVTSASLIFPTLALVMLIFKVSYSWLYYGVMLLVAALFVGKFRIPKPGFKFIMSLIAIGVIEAVLFFVFR